MKVKLELIKRGHSLSEGIYEIDDNASFGAACADAWVKVRERCAAKATSIGALMDACTKAFLTSLTAPRSD